MAKWSREDLEDFLESSTDLIHSSGLDGRIQYTNRAWREALGYTEAEVEDMYLMQVLHPDSRDYVLGLFQRIIAGESLRGIEIDVVTKDGRTLSMLGSSNCRVVDGQPVGTRAIFKDVTVAKAAERRLREAHALEQAILNGTSYIILATDPRGLIRGLNPAAEKALGVVEADAVGKISLDVFFDTDFATLASVTREHDTDEREWQLHSLTGSTFPANVALTALHNEKGVITGYAVVAMDITSRKQADEALKQATIEAQQASRAKSEFLANMSHEIRTPMNAVIGLTGLLLDTPLTEEQHEFAETIRHSGDSLLAIINDILDFSKIESGNLLLEEQPFDMRDCVESALDLIASKAAEKDLNLAYLVDDGVPQTLIGDVTRVRQVLVNLLSNAVKFTFDGEVYVHVSSRKLDDGRFEIGISVKDSGVGIPSDRIDRLFLSFSQVDASTTRNFGGTGLGLAISKRLVQLMGGDVSVESELGSGSTFSFSIVTEAGHGARRVFAAGLTPALTDRRILIVDDNATNRRIIEQHVRGWGMHPVMAGSAREALQVIEHEAAFDFAILDMQMPEMDGEALAAEWRRKHGASTPPLLLLTSVGKRGTAGERQFAAVLTKPAKPSSLYDALISTLAGTPRRRKLTPVRIIDPQFAARHPLRVMLAEDNPVNQLVATRMCERLGYRIDVVGNGLEVLQALDQIPYDLVLMDVQMPEMDGLEATRRIGSLITGERRPRICAMTASAMDEDRRECIDAGMDDYISKPVTMDALEGALLRAWQAKSKSD